MLAINAFLFVALRGIAWYDNVSNGDSGDSFPYTFNNSCGLMTQYTGKLSFGIASIKSVNIGMAESIGDDLDSDLTFFGRVNIDFFDNERFLGFVSDSSFTENWFTFETFHKKRYVLGKI